ncbi:hypothetical protein E5Q_03137 [Mixia osmundae IAM 14324]|uniref:Glycosyl transferase CAP10 domain-containing protein n=1 Tax=Mixia osmundae (strain CBS 9802 / IAM 14324 / JCM 22182 / KY 12970) TaxID=764103 RepID=G7E0W0_MIXOS|nr:hypothetical protein E5Q_03137 [Mixia osmundae IAM 14324]
MVLPEPMSSPQLKYEASKRSRAGSQHSPLSFLTRSALVPDQPQSAPFMYGRGSTGGPAMSSPRGVSRRALGRLLPLSIAAVVLIGLLWHSSSRQDTEAKPTTSAAWQIVLDREKAVAYLKQSLGLNESSSASALPGGPEHYYDAAGQLRFRQIKPAKHPISILIDRGRRDWENKLNRQSKTLDEAVREYKRRYGRAPPRGFDKWYKYAREKDHILVDEYDHLWNDIEPFLALRGPTVKARTAKVATDQNTVTASFDPQAPAGKGLFITPNRETLRDQAPLQHGRAYQVLHPLEEIIPDLPVAFNMTISEQDSGFSVLPYDHVHHLRNLARGGKKTAVEDKDGWIDKRPRDDSHIVRMCPPDSRMALLDAPVPPGVGQYDVPPFHSYIYDHAAAQDTCHNRGIYWYHSAGRITQNRQELLPMFVWSKARSHNDLTILAEDQYQPRYPGRDPEWDDKPSAKLVWRGSLTGSAFAVGNENSYKGSPRFRLSHLGEARSGGREVDIELESGGIDTIVVPLRNLTERFLDLAVTGRPIQCDESVCEELKKLINFAPRMNHEDLMQHKYVLDVDGNGWSGRFHKLLSSNSLVMKSTMHKEWWLDRLTPWVHYVPVNVDYSDIYNLMVYFEGIEGSVPHRDQARSIASEGAAFARAHWRQEDMDVWMYRMLLEWSRLYSRSDIDSFDYVD